MSSIDSEATQQSPVWQSLMKKLSDSFKWHSSPIDWCEPNYAVTPHVVEFYNSVTNTLFVVLPPILMILFHPFGKRISNRIQLIWLMMAFVGISSAYFHGTLTLSGQLLDEYGIVWMFSACVAFWFPSEFVPSFFPKSRARFELLILGIVITLTILGIVKPILNSFLMMCFTVPMIMTTIKEIQLCEDRIGKVVGVQTMLMWLLSVIIWLTDRFTCHLWINAGLPGGHWLWHILSGICCYRFIVFFLYRDTVCLHRETRPKLTCWPTTKWATLLGILYIKLDSPLPTTSSSSSPFSQYDNDNKQDINYNNRKRYNAVKNRK